jgi:hypothetical protein
MHFPVKVKRTDQSTAIIQSKMELFLNLVWLTLSVSLVWGYLAFAPAPLKSRKVTAIIALVLLIFVLLPVISMTDDLAAINNPAETDHLFRRDRAPLLLHSDVAVVAIVPLLIDIFAITVALTSGEKLRLFSLPAVLLDGAVRALGVRPPPSVSAHAA